MMLHIEFNWLDQAKNLRHGNVSLLIFWAPVSNEATCSLPCQHEAISEEQAASLRKKKRNLFILKRCQTGNLLISVSSQGSFKYFVYAPWCHCFKNQKDNPVQTRLKSVPKAPSQCLHSLHPAKHREKKNMKISNKKWLPLWLPTHPFGTATPSPFFGLPSPWFHDRASKSACTPGSPPQRAPCEGKGSVYIVQISAKDFKQTSNMRPPECSAINGLDPG